MAAKIEETDEGTGAWVAIGPVAAGVFAMVWKRDVLLDADNDNRRASREDARPPERVTDGLRTPDRSKGA